MDPLGFLLFYAYTCIIMALLMRTIVYAPGKSIDVSVPKFLGITLLYPVAIPLLFILALRDIEREEDEANDPNDPDNPNKK